MDALPQLRSVFALLGPSGLHRWGRDDYDRFHSARLAALVHHAFARVPFYRALFTRHKLDPSRVRSLHDLPRLPLLRRSDIQTETPESLVASGLDPRRLVQWRTSGSTGEPFTTRRTSLEDRLLTALRLRQQRHLGLRWSDLRARVSLGPPAQPRFRPPFAPLRAEFINIFEPARHILDRLAQIQPDILNLYPSTLDWIAAEATPEDRLRIRPRLIFTGADSLSPEMRVRISTCFHAPIRDFYGAHEFNLLAVECPQTGLYHLEEAGVFAEILRDGEPCREGETGELHATALHSFAMPFLRYSTGDLVTPGPLRCPCGAPVRTLARIDGRVVDRFALPAGGFVHPYQISLPIRQTPWVRRFRMIQQPSLDLHIDLVPMPGFQPPEPELLRLRNAIASTAPPSLSFHLQLLPELPLTPGGKFKQFTASP